MINSYSLSPLCSVAIHSFVCRVLIRFKFVAIKQEIVAGIDSVKRNVRFNSWSDQSFLARWCFRSLIGGFIVWFLGHCRSS